jgi:hypothetical protein
MGMDLYRGREYFRWDAIGWVALLETAMDYGWEPKGTGPPRGFPKKDWDGSRNYYGNEGQLFYARDAKNLAAALETFLKSSETRHVRKSKRQREVQSLGKILAGDVQGLARLIGGRTATSTGTKSKQKKALQRWNDDERKYISQFISFCRKGSFRIY